MNSNIIFTLSTIFLTIAICHFGSACKGIRNLLVEVEDIEGKRSNVTVNECIQRTSFDKKINKIHVRHQNLPRLGQDYVKHLIKLDTLEFHDCKIETIVPGAFRNLLAIRVVEITYNLITEVTGGIFDVFDTIKILKLNHNRISTITDEALSNMTMTEVDFSHNNFTEWKSVWFAYSPYIEKLDFSFNTIKTIPERAFEDMPMLKEVNFEHNRVTSIGAEAFKNLKSLEVLNLKSNQLGYINANIFPSKIKILSLNVAANSLTKLPESLLQKITLNEITLAHNPWSCPCLTKLNKWLHKYNVAVKKPDNCKLDYIPVCINVDSCELGLTNEAKTMYYNIINNLDVSQRECVGL